MSLRCLELTRQLAELQQEIDQAGVSDAVKSFSDVSKFNFKDHRDVKGRVHSGVVMQLGTRPDGDLFVRDDGMLYALGPGDITQTVADRTDWGPLHYPLNQLIHLIKDLSQLKVSPQALAITRYYCLVHAVEEKCEVFLPLPDKAIFLDVCRTLYAAGRNGRSGRSKNFKGKQRPLVLPPCIEAAHPVENINPFVTTQAPMYPAQHPGPSISGYSTRTDTLEDQIPSAILVAPPHTRTLCSSCQAPRTTERVSGPEPVRFHLPQPIPRDFSHVEDTGIETPEVMVEADVEEEPMFFPDSDSDRSHSPNPDSSESIPASEVADLYSNGTTKPNEDDQEPVVVTRNRSGHAQGMEDETPRDQTAASYHDQGSTSQRARLEDSREEKCIESAGPNALDALSQRISKALISRLPALEDIKFSRHWTNDYVSLRVLIGQYANTPPKPYGKNVYGYLTRNSNKTIGPAFHIEAPTPDIPRRTTHYDDGTKRLLWWKDIEEGLIDLEPGFAIAFNRWHMYALVNYYFLCKARVLSLELDLHFIPINGTLISNLTAACRKFPRERGLESSPPDAQQTAPANRTEDSAESTAHQGNIDETKMEEWEDLAMSLDDGSMSPLSNSLHTSDSEPKHLLSESGQSRRLGSRKNSSTTPASGSGWDSPRRSTHRRYGRFAGSDATGLNVLSVRSYRGAGFRRGKDKVANGRVKKTAVRDNDLQQKVAQMQDDIMKMLREVRTELKETRSELRKTRKQQESMSAELDASRSLRTTMQELIWQLQGGFTKDEKGGK